MFLFSSAIRINSSKSQVHQSWYWKKPRLELYGFDTRYREVVQMFPLVKGEILSTIQRYEPPRFLEESFKGTGMKGHLAYEFIPIEEGTLLVQRETIQFQGFFWLFSPIMECMLLKAVESRLEGIKTILEVRYGKENLL